MLWTDDPGNKVKFDRSRLLSVDYFLFRQVTSNRKWGLNVAGQAIGYTSGVAKICMCGDLSGGDLECGEGCPHTGKEVWERLCLLPRNLFVRK